MNTKKFSEAMNEVGDKYYEEAITYKKNTKKPKAAKWGVIAASITAAVFCAGGKQVGQRP